MTHSTLFNNIMPKNSVTIESRLKRERAPWHYFFPRVTLIKKQWKRDRDLSMPFKVSNRIASEAAKQWNRRPKKESTLGLLLIDILCWSNEAFVRKNNTFETRIWKCSMPTPFLHRPPSFATARSPSLVFRARQQRTSPIIKAADDDCTETIPTARHYHLSSS